MFPPWGVAIVTKVMAKINASEDRRFLYIFPVKLRSEFPHYIDFGIWI